MQRFANIFVTFLMELFSCTRGLQLPTDRGRQLPTALLILIPLAGVAPASAQIDPRTALIERAGWSALDGGRAREAADLFREAVAADPKNARLHLGAGMAAALERRDTDARDEFERAIA